MHGFLAVTAVLPLLMLGAPGKGAPAQAGAALPPGVVSRGAEVVLIRNLAPEQPTIFVFTRPNSTIERTFVEGLKTAVGPRAQLRLIHLATGEEPVARQYQVTETPTAMVYDRRGRLVVRSSDAAAIEAAARKAAGVMRIDWAEEGDPRFEAATRILGRKPNPGIIRTMSLQPEWMGAINALARQAHFSDTSLTRRTKEMIASYVSALNKCKF